MASVPARPAPPVVVRTETAPPQEVSVESEGRYFPETLGLEIGGEEGADYEIPLPGEDSRSRDGPVTVVKPKTNFLPKRLKKGEMAGGPPANQAVPTSPPKAIPVQLADGGATKESKSPALHLQPAPMASASGTLDDSFDTSHDTSGRFRDVLEAVIDDATIVGVLRVTDGKAEGQLFPLVKAENNVGRGVDNDVVLLDLGVSRRHVTIVRHKDGFRMVDTGSGNGSYVNGEAVSEAELYDGDFIRLGGTELEYRTQGAPRVSPGQKGVSTRFRPRRYLPPLLAFSAAFLTMMLLDWFTPTPLEKLAERGAAEWIVRADDGTDARRLGDAQQALAVSRSFGSHDDQDRVAARIEHETKNARVFADLESAIADHAPIETLDEHLSAIHEESVYRGVAGQRVRAAKKASLDRILDHAERDLAKGRSEAARLKVESVLRYDAAHIRARTLLSGLN